MLRKHWMQLAMRREGVREGFPTGTTRNQPSHLSEEMYFYKGIEIFTPNGEIKQLNVLYSDMSSGNSSKAPPQNQGLKFSVSLSSFPRLSIVTPVLHHDVSYQCQTFAVDRRYSLIFANHLPRHT